MNHPPAPSNEDFLADCTTNVFSLADIRGLRWKKFSSPCESSDCTSNDPILSAYTLARNADLLCVWKRVTQPGLTLDDSTPLFDSPKELILFWYGDEPVLNDFPGPGLREFDAGCADNGISTENLDLLFKSIHSAIEKNLLNESFVRLGKWFTKPVDAENTAEHANSLAFSFSIFTHGESSIVASVNIREKHSVQSLSKNDLCKSAQVGADTKVLLAPYGLNAQLTGHSIPDSDLRSTKIIHEWKKFFQLNDKTNTTTINDKEATNKNETLPKVIEVILGEVKMLYPSSLIFIPLTPGKKAPTPKYTNGNPYEVPSKLIDQVWNKLKKKEDQNSSSKQPWEIKENSFSSGCKCSSNSNVSRSKNTSSSNPFNASYLCNNKNNDNSKVKRDGTSTPLPSFHLRAQKAEKNQLSSTSLTGRITPLSNGYKIPSLNLPNSTEKPASISSSSNALGSIDKSSVPPVKNELISSEDNTAGVTRTITATQTYENESKIKPKAKQKRNYYILPKSLHQTLPKLPLSHIELRHNSSSENGTEDNSVKDEASPGSVFLDDEPEIKTEESMSSGKRSRNLSTSEDISKKKIKTESGEVIPVKRGPGRPKGRKNSSLTQSQVLSPLIVQTGGNDEEQITSPGTRRQSARQIAKKRESPAPSPKQDSPTQNGPGRLRKQRKSLTSAVKTPNTPKSENSVFNFGNSVNSNKTSVSSPPTPYFQKLSSSSSLTRTQDLMATAEDLKLFFDEEEDDDMNINPSINRITNSLPQSNHSLISPNQMDETMLSSATTTTTTTGCTLTSQDLAQMFPTPPSLESSIQTMSPTTLDIQMQTNTTISNTYLLSPDVHQTMPIHESETLEMKLAARSPVIKGPPTFQIPRMEELPTPKDYLPISLPSTKLKFDKTQIRKYIPSWEANQKSLPVLNNRISSNNKTVSASCAPVTTTLKTELSTVKPSNTKLSLPLASPGTFLQKQVSEIATPGFSPLTMKMQDHQSLFLNLRLTDSFMNWTNRKSNKNSSQTTQTSSTTISVQEKTSEIFNIYQSVAWKNSLVEATNHPLFPEDEPMEYTTGTPIKYVSDVETSKFPFTTELIEVLLKSFSSSLSVSYFHLILSKYYTKQLLPNTPNVNLLNLKLLSNLKPILECAIQPMRKTIFDKPKIDVPMTFNKMNKNLNKNGFGTARSSSALLFNCDNETISISPEATKNWQRLFLEPFGGPRNVKYFVVLPFLPDADVNGMKSFFKELNSQYELLNLGTHTAYDQDIRDGFLRLTPRTATGVNGITVDEWFDQSDSDIMTKMKNLAQFCKRTVGPYLSSCLDNDNNITRCSPTQLLGGESVTYGNASVTSGSLNVSLKESIEKAAKERQPTIVLYMIDPFHVETQLNNYPTIWSCVGLMRCFLELRNDLNDYLKENLLFQVIPLEQILNLNSKKGKDGGPFNSELKELALNLYTRCRPNPLSYVNKNDKCMTGFGVSHVRDSLIRRRKVENNLPVPIYFPPFTLSPTPKYLNNDISAATTAREAILPTKDVNILFCSYCLSSDKQWMFVSCSDKLGEVNETTLIRVTYPKKKRNKSMIWRVALRKLWEFVTSVLSFSICTWRLVITKYGDVGYNEFKELKDIIQKNIAIIVPPLQTGRRPISPQSDSCNSCSKNADKKGNSLYKSITLCSMQRDKYIHFVQTSGIRNYTQVKSRIYVLPTRRSKDPKQNIGSVSATSSDGMAGSNNGDTLPSASPLNTSFDEDNNDTGFLPMDAGSLFQSSPQCEISKILSPQNTASPQQNMTSLSPFQPIQNKQQHVGLTTPSKLGSTGVGSGNEDNEVLSDCLCIGYLLSISMPDRDAEKRQRVPTAIKVELHYHVTGHTNNSELMKSSYHPLDTNNFMEVVKCILEHFDMLSWLTVSPSSGKRQSSFPVHVNTILTCREILKTLTG